MACIMRMRPQQALLAGCAVLPVKLQGGPADAWDTVQNSISGMTSSSLNHSLMTPQPWRQSVLLLAWHPQFAQHL